MAGYDDDTHEVMRALLREKLAPVPATGFAVAPSLEQLHRISAVTGETLAGETIKTVYPQYRRAGRLLLSAHHGRPERARRVARYARHLTVAREIHAVAGADLDQGAVAGNRPGSTGPVRWPSKRVMQAAAATAGHCSGRTCRKSKTPAACIRPMPGWRTAMPEYLPQRRAGAAAGARSLGAGRRHAAAAERGGPPAGRGRQAPLDARQVPRLMARISSR